MSKRMFDEDECALLLAWNGYMTGRFHARVLIAAAAEQLTLSEVLDLCKCNPQRWIKGLSA